MRHAAKVLLAIMALCALAGRPAAAADIAAGVRAGDPSYRELRIAAALGLLDGPLHGREPLSRAEVYRLLRPAVTVAGDTAFVRADPWRGLTEATAYRLDRLRREICPWDDFWERPEYPVTFGGSLAGRLAVNASDVARGDRAPDYLDYGYARRQGIEAERDGRLYLEAEGFALDAYGRLRVDADALTYRPLVLGLRTGWRNLRLFVGREPMAWSTGVHGSLLLTTNARPLDQVRLESDAPFALPGPLRGAGRFTASVFLSRLRDDKRTDAPNPALTGTRVTWSPARWLVLGGSRTVLLGGEGHEFAVTPRSVWNVLTVGHENRFGDDVTNDTDQLASVDWSVYLWPVLRPVPLLDGGRLYGEYGGEDSPQSGPLPSAVGRLYGIELVSHGVLVRAEASANIDDRNLWYWHRIYTGGYTYRGVVIGHPMGGDSRAQSYDLEVPLARWGLVTLTMERQEHGFRALPGEPGAALPVPHGVQDTFKLGVEKYLGTFPGALRVELRAMREFGDLDRLGPLERWGATVEWRR
jgi:hypothetical protein